MIVFSGIQPTGDIHIGNYLGAIKQWKKLQEDDNFSRLFFIVDYHSLTANPVSAKEKRNQIEQLAVDLLAVGLDPEKSILAIQSHIPEVLELAWIFNCLTPMGELERMTQFKDKSKRQDMVSNAGLFTYPILQAADILLYQAEMVPVGEDQLQHLELARETARRFNRRYGEFFKEPKQRISRVPKLMSLNNPLKKMSKSDLNSYIGIFDEPDDIRKKIRSAVSADNDFLIKNGVEKIYMDFNNNSSIWKMKKIKKEDIDNLLRKNKEITKDKQLEISKMESGLENIFRLLGEFNKEKFDEITFISPKELGWGDIPYIDLKKLKYKYSEIKNILAESIINYFAPMREKRNELMRDKQAVMRIYEEGAEKARVIAQETMREVRKLVGLS